MLNFRMYQVISANLRNFPLERIAQSNSIYNILHIIYDRGVLHIYYRPMSFINEVSCVVVLTGDDMGKDTT